MAVPLYLAALFFACWYAIAKGGAPERIGIAILAIGSALTALAARVDALDFQGFELNVFLVDFAVLIAFMWLAIRADRFWPLWVAAFQAVGWLSHLVQLASSEVLAWAYATGQLIWGYPILFLITQGVWRHRQRLIRTGTDNSWKRSSSPAGPSVLEQSPPG